MKAIALFVYADGAFTVAIDGPGGVTPLAAGHAGIARGHASKLVWAGAAGEASDESALAVKLAAEMLCHVLNEGETKRHGKRARKTR